MLLKQYGRANEVHVGIALMMQKKITLTIFPSMFFFLLHFFTVPPVIMVPNQLVGAPLGTDVTLECLVEASPRSINYWHGNNGKLKVYFNYFIF